MQAGGRRFDPDRLHHVLVLRLRGLEGFWFWRRDGRCSVVGLFDIVDRWIVSGAVASRVGVAVPGMRVFLANMSMFSTVGKTERP